MPPREPSAVRPPACKLFGFPSLSNDNSRTQLIALSTAYPWYSLNMRYSPQLPTKSLRLNTLLLFENSVRRGSALFILSISFHFECAYACHDHSYAASTFWIGSAKVGEHGTEQDFSRACTYSCMFTWHRLENCLATCWNGAFVSRYCNSTTDWSWHCTRSLKRQEKLPQ